MFETLNATVLSWQRNWMSTFRRRERKNPFSVRAAPMGWEPLMKTYAARANVPPHKRHFYVLKHSIVTHLLDAGAELRLAAGSNSELC